MTLGFQLSEDVCNFSVEQLYVGCQQASSWGTNAWKEELWAGASDAFKRLIRPALEREWRRQLKDLAEDDAFDTYRRNLHTKLLTPPLRLQPAWNGVVAVLGICIRSC